MSLETITIKLDDYNKMKKENEELKDLCWETQQQLNEESQERLKNKECWMSVKDKYWELKEENDKLKEKNATWLKYQEEDCKLLNATKWTQLPGDTNKHLYSYINETNNEIKKLKDLILNLV
mgnify:FL=1|tara:strand:- start:820 stop:1185 length:366 start_codon:yes stop_codon:yes gene_type:complete